MICNHHYRIVKNCQHCSIETNGCSFKMLLLLLSILATIFAIGYKYVEDKKIRGQHAYLEYKEGIARLELSTEEAKMRQIEILANKEVAINAEKTKHGVLKLDIEQLFGELKLPLELDMEELKVWHKLMDQLLKPERTKRVKQSHGIFTSEREEEEYLTLPIERLKEGQIPQTSFQKKIKSNTRLIN